MNILVVSLPNSPRRAVIESWLNHDFEYVDGIRVNASNKEELLKQFGVVSDLPDGDLGCALAHISIYKMIGYDRRYKEGALVLEDDAYPLPIVSLANIDKPHAWYNKTIHEVAYNVGDGFDYVNLIKEVRWGLQAQFVTARGARILWDSRQKLVREMAIDQYIKLGQVESACKSLKITNGRPIFGHKDDGRNSERIGINNGMGN